MTLAAWAALFFLIPTPQSDDADLVAQYQAAKKSCDEGKPEGCDYVALAYSNGLGVTRDVSRAYALYKKSCDAGRSLGCVRLGSGGGSLFSLWTQACDLGSAVGCFDLAVMYDEGLGIPADRPHAAALLKMVCDSGDKAACARAATLAKAGVVAARLPSQAPLARTPEELAERVRASMGSGSAPPEPEASAPDEPRTVADYDKACAAGDGLECVRLGTLYAAGEGVPKDFVKSNGYYQKACDGSDTDARAFGCYGLGLQYERGLGVKKDKAKAATIFQRACDAGSKPSCERLGK